MKTYEQLMKHYWGVIVPMAESAGIDPWECVRWIYKLRTHPIFDDDPSNYTFALTVLEGKPVFVGDKVFHKASGIMREISSVNLVNDFHEKFTLTPPTKKRTFMLNGVELNSPVNKGKGDYLTRVAGNEFYFTNYDDRNALDNILYELLTTAREKE